MRHTAVVRARRGERVREWEYIATLLGIALGLALGGLASGAWLELPPFERAWERVVAVVGSAAGLFFDTGHAGSLVAATFEVALEFLGVALEWLLFLLTWAVPCILVFLAVALTATALAAAVFGTRTGP